MSLTDTIIFIPSFSALVEHFLQNHPENLEYDEEGELTNPPTIVGMTRTPAVVNGDKLLAYCRFTADQAEQWRGTPGVEVLAEAPFAGEGTADKIYNAILNNPDALAKYDSVWNRTKTYTDEDGVEHTYEQTKFGIIGGA